MTASPALSMLDNPELAPQELAARMLVTPTALDDLTLANARVVVGYMRPKRIKAGTVIIQEGEARHTDTMLLVLEGDIAVESPWAGGRESWVVQVIGPGHLIGEMGVLDGLPRSATCTASTDIAAAVLSRTALMRLLKDEPLVGSRLLLAISKRLSDRLRETTRKLNTFAQMNQALRAELQDLHRQRVAPGEPRG